MLKKTVSTLFITALTTFGTMQLAHAQKNYTDGGDLYGGAHTQQKATKKATTNQSAAKSGKFDPYTDGAAKSTESDLAPGAKADPYTDGGRKVTDPRDPYTDGGRKVTDPRDPYTDGGKH